MARVALFRFSVKGVTKRVEIELIQYTVLLLLDGVDEAVACFRLRRASAESWDDDGDFNTLALIEPFYGSWGMVWG